MEDRKISNRYVPLSYNSYSKISLALNRITDFRSKREYAGLRLRGIFFARYRYPSYTPLVGNYGTMVHKD